MAVDLTKEATVQPGPFSGRWFGAAESDGGMCIFDLYLRQNGFDVNGASLIACGVSGGSSTGGGAGANAPILSAKVTGNRLSMSFDGQRSREFILEGGMLTASVPGDESRPVKLQLTRVPEVPASWTTLMALPEEEGNKVHMIILQFEDKDGPIQGKYTDGTSYPFSGNAIRRGNTLAFTIVMKNGSRRFGLVFDGAVWEGRAVMTEGEQSRTIKITAGPLE